MAAQTFYASQAERFTLDPEGPVPHPTQIASSLADPERLNLFARVVCAGPEGLASEDLRAGGPQAAKRLSRLLRDGLLQERNERVVADTGVFQEAVEGRRPVEATPVDTLFHEGRLRELPAKRALRRATLRRVADRLFSPEEEYTEKQVNSAILTCFDDPSAMRRYLVEEGYLEREADGSRYRVARV
ncbi:DUF2087 domain-containing protein [Nocardiopsis sp. CNT312]|uniref:DUF2087 domain-containing protein n=1 Tax=Nocardiopsis sp. CNT312 TaxID=1137268 RepID=UPI0004B025F9